MSKKKKDKKEEEAKEVKPFIITAVAINDDFCNYSFEVQKGEGVGDTHSVKGKGIIDEDLRIAMSRLNVHFACLDDAFLNAAVEIANIDKFHNHKFVGNYEVSGIQIKGSAENESIILAGNKYSVTSGGRSSVKLPQVLLDALSGYKWYNELKEAADNVRMEVELYKGGKCTAPEADLGDSNQLTIQDQIASTETDFLNAKV